MATGNDILAIAAKEIGYHEGTNKNNKFGKWYGLNNAAWCMIFCQWVYAQAGSKLPFRTASCSALLNWYKENQPECVVETPTPGCLVIFDLPNTAYKTDHVGLFESFSGHYITTIDGNTSSQNDANGGYVNRRIRNKKYVYAYIRPREITRTVVTASAVSVKTEAPKQEIRIEEDEDVKRYQTLEEIKKEASWAAPTVEKLVSKKALAGDGKGLDLSYDMLRMLVIHDRLGLYQ